MKDGRHSEPDFFDVAIATKMDTTNLVSLLDDETLLGSWDQGDRVHLYWPVHAWGTDKLVRLTQLLEQLAASKEKFTIEITRCPFENWNARWAELVKPLRIGQRILIQPSWETAELPEKGIQLILDPKQAFGTGHHATTQLLITWLEDIIRGGERVLDVGTGSGILAMVALRLGAGCAVGIDNDPLAIECAKEYAKVNRIGEDLQFRVQDLTELETSPFDLVLANLDRRTLLQHAKNLQGVRTPHTHLLLSGILSEDEIDVTNFFVAQDWVFSEMRQQDGWLALKFQSPSPT